MKLENLSSQPLGVLHSWIPHQLDAEEMVFLPDACPGKSPLPTGTAVYTKQENWRQFAVSDCGCGMRLLRATVDSDDLSLEDWNLVSERLRANKGKLGDLGGGNHFLDALESYDEDSLYFLIHTGSRSESGHVDAYIDQPSQFDQEFNRVVGWAKDNRAQIHQELESVFGKLELIYDKPHNTYEVLEDGGVIIRKGSVKLNPGEVTVIPSHMSGDVVLVEATEKISEVFCSMSHGTGRKKSRSAAKEEAQTFDFGALRERILIPDGVENASLRSDAPNAYRDLDECLELIDGYVNELKRFSVIGYMGHL